MSTFLEDSSQDSLLNANGVNGFQDVLHDKSPAEIRFAEIPDYEGALRDTVIVVQVSKLIEEIQRGNSSSIDSLKDKLLGYYPQLPQGIKGDTLRLDCMRILYPDLSSELAGKFAHLSLENLKFIVHELDRLYRLSGEDKNSRSKWLVDAFVLCLSKSNYELWPADHPATHFLLTLLRNGGSEVFDDDELDQWSNFYKLLYSSYTINVNYAQLSDFLNKQPSKLEWWKMLVKKSDSEYSIKISEMMVRLSKKKKFNMKISDWSVILDIARDISSNIDQKNFEEFFNKKQEEIWWVFKQYLKNGSLIELFSYLENMYGDFHLNR